MIGNNRSHGLSLYFPAYLGFDKEYRRLQFSDGSTWAALCEKFLLRKIEKPHEVALLGLNHATKADREALGAIVVREELDKKLRKQDWASPYGEDLKKLSLGFDSIRDPRPYGLIGRGCWKFSRRGSSSSTTTSAARSPPRGSNRWIPTIRGRAGRASSAPTGATPCASCATAAAYWWDRPRRPRPCGTRRSIATPSASSTWKSGIAATSSPSKGRRTPRPRGGHRVEGLQGQSQVFDRVRPQGRADHDLPEARRRGGRWGRALCGSPRWALDRRQDLAGRSQHIQTLQSGRLGLLPRRREGGGQPPRDPQGSAHVPRRGRHPEGFAGRPEPRGDSQSQHWRGAARLRRNGNEKEDK